MIQKFLVDKRKLVLIFSFNALFLKYNFGRKIIHIELELKSKKCFFVQK